MRRNLWALLISAFCFAVPLAAQAAGAMGPNGLTNECTHQLRALYNVSDVEARRLPEGFAVSYLGRSYTLGKEPPTTLWGVCKILVESGDFTQANVAGARASASPTAPAPTVIAPPVAPKPQTTLQPPVAAKQPQPAPHVLPELTAINPAVAETPAPPVERQRDRSLSPALNAQLDAIAAADAAADAERTERERVAAINAANEPAKNDWRAVLTSIPQTVWAWSTDSWWQITLSVVGAIVLLLAIAYGLLALYFRLQPEDELEEVQDETDLAARRYVDPADEDEEELADSESDAPVFAGYDNRTAYERLHDEMGTDDLPTMHAADLGDVRPPPQSGQRHH